VSWLDVQGMNLCIFNFGNAHAIH